MNKAGSLQSGALPPRLGECSDSTWALLTTVRPLTLGWTDSSLGSVSNLFLVLVAVAGEQEIGINGHYWC